MLDRSNSQCEKVNAVCRDHFLLFFFDGLHDNSDTQGLPSEISHTGAVPEVETFLELIFGCWKLCEFCFVIFILIAHCLTDVLLCVFFMLDDWIEFFIS